MTENPPFLSHVDQIRREMTSYGMVQLEVDKHAKRVRLSIDSDCDKHHHFETVIEASLENAGTIEVKGREHIDQPYSAAARTLVALGVSNSSNLERMLDEVRYVAHLEPAKQRNCR